MKVKNIVFAILEILGVGMIYLGFKTRGVESIVLGIGGLLFMIVIGLYFTRDTSVQSRQN
ncbi:hypothetical protein [Sulfurisphaera ohwakuensis]|uniref:Putative membrane protein YphA (DoxX/SURF4 family) n=1 Tax=Sulfurisphaera ohwakuensis TaxID=69656 RepID=A0A650CIC8_SULOH|nr:hypothetical protein [Sulfurisphaera ohwakuensis]MBB5253796.1 putative membrane protein YphA (DoxX/SURF4 family) [Sulfurisphaera ohwakuensis]QGR17529.1 hypothetical protein D1869_10265 [Sulfurisphaera ohwakuensis]